MWMFEAETPPSKFTFDGAGQLVADLVADGTRIALASRRNNKWTLRRSPTTPAGGLVLNRSCLGDANELAGRPPRLLTSDPKTAGDIWSVQLGTASGDRKPVPILQTRADERNPQVSPDGKWIAYSSNESGRSEIYVRPFPEGPGRILVSVNGGVFPRWRRDGRELYFMSLVTLGSMMASEIRVSGASVQREVPRILFPPVFPGGTHAGGSPTRVPCRRTASDS